MKTLLFLTAVILAGTAAAPRIPEDKPLATVPSVDLKKYAGAWYEIASFPQKFYAGEHPLLLDLSAHPEVKFLRAHWEVNRWGRGPDTPLFEFHVTLKQVPKEVLAEAVASAGR